MHRKKCILLAAVLTCRGVGDFPVLAGTAAHVKIFGVIAHQPYISPWFCCCNHNGLWRRQLCVSTLLYDYLHIVTYYPIQQVLAPCFATRSFETLWDAGTSPGAKLTNFPPPILRQLRRYDCEIQLQAFAQSIWINITLRWHRYLTSNSLITNNTLLLQNSYHGDGLP